LICFSVVGETHQAPYGICEILIGSAWITLGNAAVWVAVSTDHSLQWTPRINVYSVILE
jgi:hypothetical protein